MFVADRHDRGRFLSSWLYDTIFFGFFQQQTKSKEQTMNIFIRFIVRLLFVAGMIKTSVARRMGFGKRKTATSIKVGFIETPARQIIIKRELPFGHLTCASEHALTDADKQLELFKWKFGREDFDDFSFVSLEISNARAMEKAHDKRVKYASPFFPKEKLKPEAHSQKVMDEAVARQKRRQQSILAADGMLWRGTFPSRLSKSSFEVVNGKFPDTIT
jgi:hypothetical protein